MLFGNATLLNMKYQKFIEKFVKVDITTQRGDVTVYIFIKKK